MKTPAPVVVSCALLAMYAGACSSERCDDLTANPIDGTYRGEASSPSLAVRDVRVDASSEQLTLTYSRADGRSFRAVYRVKSPR